MLSVAILAWLGVSTGYQGRGLGRLLLAQALRDCYEAGKTFAFIAVILDCISDAAKRFYQQWEFQEVPGQPKRLFLSAKSPRRDDRRDVTRLQAQTHHRTGKALLPRNSTLQHVF